MHRTHALAAAAGTGFDQQGEADAFRLALGLGRVRHGTLGAGHHGDVSNRHSFFGREFGAHDANGVGVRSHEPNACALHRLGEFGVLAQEAISRVDGVCAGGQRGFHNAVDDEVTLVAGGRTHTHGFVGRQNVGRLRVRFAVHGDGGNAHVARSAHDADGDFATVGHKKLGDGADV